MQLCIGLYVISLPLSSFLSIYRYHFIISFYPLLSCSVHASKLSLAAKKVPFVLTLYCLILAAIDHQFIFVLVDCLYDVYGKPRESSLITINSVNLCSTIQTGSCGVQTNLLDDCTNSDLTLSLSTMLLTNILGCVTADPFYFFEMNFGIISISFSEELYFYEWHTRGHLKKKGLREKSG